MDGNFSEMLKGVLEDPEAMKKLMGAAETLMGGEKGEKSANERGSSREKFREEPREDFREDFREAPASSRVEERKPPSPSEHKAGNAERIALVAALRPYLSPERRQTADSLLKMLKMLNLTELNRLFG